MAVMIDYDSAVPQPTSFDAVAEGILAVWAERYRQRTPNANLREFTFAGGVFLLDEAPQESDRPVRTIGAITRAVAPVDPRETSYQHGFPLQQEGALRPVDRGHLIPYSGGGLFGPNLFRQDRALNRGWSADGIAYRRLEREAVQHGALFFCALDYCDDTDYPSIVELGLWRGHEVTAQPFRNRWDAAALSDLPGPPEPARALLHYLGGLTKGQLGDLGEETIRFFIEDDERCTVITLGDSGMPRTENRQDLDLVIIEDTELIAVEVKTRFLAANAGRTTKAGNLPRPRLRPGRLGSGTPRQGSAAYVRDRLSDILDTSADQLDVRFVTYLVDLKCMKAQVYIVNDTGRIRGPAGAPVDISQYAQHARETLQSFGQRGY